MKIEPYLFFNGRCDEAIAFYRGAVGAEVLMLLRYKESPEPPQPGMLPPGSENKVMHSTLRIGDTNVMASDGRSTGESSFQGFSLSISLKDEASAARVYQALAAGGKSDMPLTKTFFSKSFGMLTDRFGIAWMINVPAQEA